jgi:hypothetical protein
MQNRQEVIDQKIFGGYCCIMLENRKTPRYRTLARARISGILDGENILKDLSITGCCVECTVNAKTQTGTQYQMEIQPEGASGIGNFQFTVEQKWARNEGYATEIGFSITDFPKGKQFERYVDYLAYRSSTS